MQQVKQPGVNQKRLKNSRYISGFDGIRAFAVFGVIIYHLLPYKLQGGYMGVPIFFAVSGYLITDLLIQEWEQNGKIDFKGFYIRRLKRLYPALVFMLVTAGAYITIFQRSLLTNLRSIITTNLVYLYNWWEVGHGQSYFDRFNGESPFTHLWSLSIEGQYYLIWPLLLTALIVLLKNKRRIADLLLLCAAGSAVLMGILYNGADTLNRVYYGTDTRMYSIILGAALAVAWPSTHLKAKISNGSKMLLNGIGLASILIMGYLFFNMSGQSTFTYRGGMFIMSLVATVLIATCVHPGASVNKWLTNPVFSWIGTRSYGIYLYQFPVMVFYEAKVKDIANHPFINALIEIAIILIISELSYRYIEAPFRHYHYSEIKSSIVKFFSVDSPYGLKRLWVIPSIFVLFFCIYGSIIAPTHSQKTKLQDDITKNVAAVKNKNDLVLAKQKKAKSEVKLRKLTRTEYKTAKKYDLTKKQYLKVSNTPITAIGDSILADSSSDMQKVFQQAYVSAAVGRQIWQASDVIDNLKAKGELAPNVLINLGTNSPVTDEQMDSVIKKIGHNRQIFWVNCHVPTRNWEGQVNASIAKAAKKYKNVHVIDWHGYSSGKTSIFWEDDIHPNPKGNIYYTHLAATQISKNIK